MRTETQPDAVFSDLLVQMRVVKARLSFLLEQTKGPGKHLVFMNLKDAAESVSEAICEEETNLWQRTRRPQNLPGATKWQT
jgi:hypothetical protein